MPDDDDDASTIPTAYDDDDSSLLQWTYQAVLGRGRYKTVYRVQDGRDGTCHALSVQRLRTKADVQDGWRGIRVAERLFQEFSTMASASDESEECQASYYPFERVERWWFQSVPPSEFTAPGSPVFPSSQQQQRTQQPPSSRFRGTRWLVALKPLYAMDLAAFGRTTPLRYSSCRDGGDVFTTTGSINPNAAAAASSGDSNRSSDRGVRMPLTDTGATRLARDLLRAGRLLHDRAGCTAT